MPDYDIEKATDSLIAANVQLLLLRLSAGIVLYMLLDARVATAFVIVIAVINYTTGAALSSIYVHKVLADRERWRLHLGTEMFFSEYISQGFPHEVDIQQIWRAKLKEAGEDLANWDKDHDWIERAMFKPRPVLKAIVIFVLDIPVGIPVTWLIGTYLKGTFGL